MSMNVIILLKGGKIKWVGEVGGNVANSYAIDQFTQSLIHVSQDVEVTRERKGLSMSSSRLMPRNS